ncbi:MAG TPA: TlyA family RNA methyltransferase [Hyphomicrobiaceae bacterium]|nr:TlyA family RNA methyltransferase [Hyphomicrobiaceae bacterium]
MDVQESAGPKIVRQRLDQVLVMRGLVQSRARAADLIARGAVTVEGRIARKAGVLVEADIEITVDALANAHVARSGAKLVAALEAFGFDPAGRVALDVGASTGGFTQVLLEGGVKRVYAVDVGRGQLHETLRANPRVISMEGQDARALSRELVIDPAEAIVADVSFLSLRQALPVPLQLAAPACWLVALVKPQFEAGRAAVGKRGVVRDEAAHKRALEDVAAFLEAAGWRVIGSLPSPLRGKEGNTEWLIGAVLGDG